MERDQASTTSTAAGGHTPQAAQRTQQRIFEAHGWHAVTLSASTWSGLRDEQAKQRYLASTINEAISGGAGHGHSHAHGGCCGGGCSSNKN